MNAIEKALEENKFTEEEKEAFLEIIKEAKLLQRTTQLENLKPYIKDQVEKVVRHENNKD